MDAAMLRDDDYAAFIEASEEELIEDFLENSLLPDDRIAFAKRMQNSAELRNRVSLVAGIKRIAANEPEKADAKNTRSQFGLFFQRLTVIRFAIVLMGLCLIGLVVWKAAFSENEIDIALNDLKRAAAGQRLTVGRSTLNSTYSPVIATRGPRTSVDQSSPEFKKAKALLLTAEVREPENPRILHLLGLTYLAEQNFDKALTEMQKAEKLDPKNSSLLSDIGTVILEKSLRDESDGNFSEKTRNEVVALDYTERSLALEPKRPEALFNRALVLDEMGLTEQAKKAWQEYLAVDPNSEWSAEARKRLEALERTAALSNNKDDILKDFQAAFDLNDKETAWRIVSESKELISGSVVFFQIVDRYIDTSLGTIPGDADRELRELKFVSEIEAERSSDTFFPELYDYYRRASVADLEKVGEANVQAREGYRLMFSSTWPAALSAFENAKSLYLDAGNNWEADIAEFQICYVLTQRREVEQSTERLRRLGSSSTEKKHVWISSLVDSWIASNYSLSGDYSTAVRFNDRALKSAKQIDDSYGIQKAAGQLANQYLKLGNESRVLGVIGENRSAKPKYFRSPRQLSRNLLFASQGFRRFGYLAASEANAREQLFVSREVLHDDWFTHSAYLNLAGVHSSRGQHDIALDDAAECFRLAGSFQDESMRRRLELQCVLLLADVNFAADRYSEALESYDRVIRDFGSTEFVTSLYQARKGRLLCLKELGRDAEFTSEMGEVIALFQKDREIIENESDRNLFFDGQQSIYDIATEYAFSKMNDASMAFAYAEGSRANSLLGLISGNTNQSAQLSDLKSGIPDDTCVLYFAVLPQRTLVWAVTNEGWDVAVIPISSEELASRIASFSDSIAIKRSSKDQAVSLHSLLIGPVVARLNGKTLLCIVPDKSLFNLSFAALRSAQTEKYLIEENALMYSPSMRVFEKLSELSDTTPRNRESEKFVGIGASVFNRTDNVGLADIPGVKDEVIEISKAYGSSTIHTDKDVTRDVFLKSAGSGSIFHFAGHYISNKNAPVESRFLVSDGSVTVGELFANINSAPRLVILSACESGTERYYAGEGMIGASRAFLGIGVPTVVGSLWAVDSDATRQLMIGLHRFRTSGNMSSAEALRAAQVELLRGQGEYTEPFYWAAFMPIGGHGV